MAEGDYPLLVLAAPVVVAPLGKTQPIGGAQNPGKGVQIQRLEPQFLELQRVLDAHNAIVSSTAGAASAEHVLVFETNGPPAEFFNTVAALPDLEWLVDHEEKVDPDEYFKVKGSGRKLTACIYMILFNQKALQELLSLWKLYKTTTRMPDGHGAWSAVFRCLRTIRRWGPEDRLLDWLAWKHRVLFVVSAGNHKTELPSECADDREALRHAFVESRHRRLLSPAETLNGLTVGALNRDSAGPPLQPGSRPIPERPDLPAMYSAQGRGIRRGVKPDLLAPGGRQLFQRKLPTVGSSWVPSSFQQVGHLVAVPASSGSKPTTWFSGTSNAAALTSRAAIVVNRAIEQLLATEEGRWLREVPAAVLVKAMLVHTAEWHEDTLSFAQDALQGLLDRSRGKDQLSGILGYGVLRAARGVVCAPERATAIGGGILAANQRALHRFPIPKCLHLHRAWRRLTATLAWFSPINPADRRYRVARLQMDIPKKDGSPLLVDGGQVHADATIRGTVQHVILERARAVIDAGEDAELEIGVTCSEDAPSLSEPIPYALAVSLEIAAGTSVLVYQQVAARLRVQPRARVSPTRVAR